MVSLMGVPSWYRRSCWGILTDCEQGHQKCARDKALQYLRPDLAALDPREAEEEVFRVRPVALTVTVLDIPDPPPPPPMPLTAFRAAALGATGHLQAIPVPSVTVPSAAVTSAAISSSPPPVPGQVSETRLCRVRGVESAAAAHSSDFAKKLARPGASGPRDGRGLGDRDGRHRWPGWPAHLVWRRPQGGVNLVRWERPRCRWAVGSRGPCPLKHREMQPRAR